MFGSGTLTTAALPWMKRPGIQITNFLIFQRKHVFCVTESVHNMKPVVSLILFDDFTVIMPA